jgi:hypothetical protein
MRRWKSLIAIAAFAPLAIATCHAQKMTEMYIPIGQSPGLSGKYTTIGTITTVNPQTKALTCTYGAGSISFSVTPRTRFWLDRSALKAPNTKGTFADCAVGKKVEVKTVNNTRADGSEVEWIKIQVTSP